MNWLQKCDREMKLRPYHNPENVDESRVPDGWRFRYSDEFRCGQAFSACRIWLKSFDEFCGFKRYRGNIPHRTYIVPVNA